MTSLLPVIGLAALLAASPTPTGPAADTPVIIYSADVPIRAVRRMGPIRIEVSTDEVRARNSWAHGWLSDDASHLAVRWNRPPLRASLPCQALPAAISRLLSADEHTSTGSARLERLADPRDSIMGYSAELYRLRFGTRSWIDVWTTRELARSEPFAALLPLTVAPFSARGAELVREIPGMPLHVELRSQRLGVVDLLRLEKVDDEHSIPRRRGFALPVPFARLLLRALG